jgi:hypothetical protein
VIFYLGIDDTGKPGTVGTQELALELGRHLESHSIARLIFVSAHPLLPATEIPGSSTNTTYCLTLEGAKQHLREIDMESRVYIMRNASAGANAGFALVQADAVTRRILSFSQACRTLEMQRRDALELARESGIVIAGFTGNGKGVIGALAAVGWRWHGSDGTITWMPGLEDLKGVMTLGEIFERCKLDYIKSVRGKTPLFDDRIHLGENPTPLLKTDRSLLLLEPAPRNADWEWNAVGVSEVHRITW